MRIKRIGLAITVVTVLIVMVQRINAEQNCDLNIYGLAIHPSMKPSHKMIVIDTLLFSLVEHYDQLLRSRFINLSESELQELEVNFNKCKFDTNYNLIGSNGYVMDGTGYTLFKKTGMDSDIVYAYSPRDENFNAVVRVFKKLLQKESSVNTIGALDKYSHFFNDYHSKNRDCFTDEEYSIVRYLKFLEVYVEREFGVEN